ncbi:MAG: hypothetical protein HeimC2_32390 [Candidatus Heimdallarchaeota archaeon LC_2]|nr:MAG: hypothetical protein HeimC2_32390 [Candidatus Heimdallarchaeota archaeon LC_2]
MPEDAITTIFTRIVKPDKIKEFEDWITEVSEALSNFKGYLGLDIIRPIREIQPEYVLILKFANYENVKQWMGSEVRKGLVQQSMVFTIGDIQIEQKQGLEYWFEITTRQQFTDRPARYKMTILTVFALYPLIFVSNLTLVPAMSFIISPIVLLINLSIIVSLMTYVVMPRVTMLFRSWLF